MKDLVKSELNHVEKGIDKNKAALEKLKEKMEEALEKAKK
jgi:prefoldin subunit 5